ncbi:hypothetical protein [Nocardia altamirensis]|uniref:hypothetical protein n=1 Tax=Nocardia altamirensis TaxID=472158 RepID=UPI00083FF7A8|nr:hypothetical protein [Nocardia altamirensis]
MRELTDEEAGRVRAALLESEQELSATWSSASERVVVPGAEISELTQDPSGRRILAAFADRGYHEVYCLTTAELGPGQANQAVAIDLAGVNDWWWQHAPFDIVIASLDLAAVVLLSVDEFVLVGGDRGFVESALGQSVEAGCAEFTVYAEDMANASRHLPELAQRWCGGVTG